MALLVSIGLGCSAPEPTPEPTEPHVEPSPTEAEAPKPDLARPPTKTAEDAKVRSPPHIALEGVPLDWVHLNGGRFEMRSDVDDALHTVEVGPIAIARAEVTFAQYERCVTHGPCTPVQWEGCDHDGMRQFLEDPARPVVCVSWEQARVFSEWVGGDLPSEVEWEYAARGGGLKRDFPWGDERPSCRYAVMNWGCAPASKNQSTAPPCSKPAGNTEQGVCDMAGNVAEWTGKVAPWDPETIKLGTKIVRGGAWAGIDPPYYRNSPKGPSLLRIDHRSRNGRSMRSSAYGFRPLRRAIPE